MSDATVHLVRGDDPTLLSDAVRDLVTELVGEGDRSLMVDEWSGDEFELSAAIDAAQTLPFLTERRVVVVRNAGRFSTTEALTPLLTYLGDPSPTTSLVLVWEKGSEQQKLPARPKKLSEALSAAGGVDLNASPGTGRARKEWLDERLGEAGVSLDREAQTLLADQVGDDLDRLGGILETLDATYGSGARLGVDEVAPYLGAPGSVKPWDLTDAIDRGDTPLALDRLHRMQEAGNMHGLQIMATLHNHYTRMLRLDGSGADGEKAAASVLGLKGSTFPARKALEQSRRLGPERLRRAIHLLAQADLDLRGAKAWPQELVMEVLVARLSTLAGRRGR